MKYLLDTDHLSILQRQTGDAYSSLSARSSVDAEYEGFCEGAWIEV
jgi:hypothetical protein